MTAELALNRIENGEDVRTAFFPDAKDTAALARTVCSFLNAEGGVLFCGVDGTGQVVGLPQAMTKKTAQRIELEIKTKLSPTPLLTGGLEKIDDKRVLVIEAPAGNDRPYVFEGAVWIRRNAETRPADAGALRALVKGQGDTPQRWERRTSPSMTDDDLDRREVRDMAKAAHETERFSFPPTRNELEILREISLWTTEGFTQGADVLFSKAPWRRHPQCRVQWVEFAGDKIGDAYTNQRWLKGPMVRVCRELFETLGSINKVKARFRPGRLHREDTLMYPAQALREGVVNALVHRDYASYSGGMRISVYPGRVEIWNSGRLPAGIKPGDLKRDHPSILINPDITQTFYIAGLMEGIGRGTQKIVADCRDLGAPVPVWKDAPSGVTLTIFAAGEEVEESVPDINERQKSLLSVLAIGNGISVPAYHQAHARQVSERQARRDLTDLVVLGELRREGRGPNTIYRRVRSAIRT